MSYGDWMRRARRAKALTQRELGERVGATDGYVSHIEQGLRVPSLEMAVALAQALDMSPDDQRRFLDAVDEARVERSRIRLDRRRAALRGVLAREPDHAAAAPEDAAPGATALDLQVLERELEADPTLAAAHRHLMAVYADPNLRDAVVKTLQVLAASSRASRNDAPSTSDTSSSDDLDG